MLKPYDGISFLDFRLNLFLSDKKSTVNTDIILNTGADDDFGTVIRRPRNNDLLTPPESKDWNIQVQSNPVVDEQVKFDFLYVLSRNHERA